MNNKFSLEIAKSNRFRQIKIFQEDSGFTGQTTVIKVIDSVYLQLVHVATLASPDKVGLKRVEKKWPHALPRCNLWTTYVKAKDYFALIYPSTEGRTIDSEWTAYDAVSLAQSPLHSRSNASKATTLNDALVIFTQVIQQNQLYAIA